MNSILYPAFLQGYLHSDQCRGSSPMAWSSTLRMFLDTYQSILSRPAVPQLILHTRREDHITCSMTVFTLDTRHITTAAVRNVYVHKPEVCLIEQQEQQIPAHHGGSAKSKQPVLDAAVPNHEAVGFGESGRGGRLAASLARAVNSFSLCVSTPD